MCILVSKNGSKNALIRASLQEYKWALAAGIIPRLFQVGFLFGQPFLVRRTVLLMSEEPSQYSSYSGYGLIVAFAIVFTGIAVRMNMFMDSQWLACG